MGRKKRGVNVLKPFCYYCEKEFENANILLQHQKNRHFACKLCTRKFSTASSLQTHMNQVHGQSLPKVSNAIAGRDRVDINIYGMDEVPVEIIEDRIAKKINKKKAKMDNELKKAFGIDLDDAKFNIADYEVPEPRPRKMNRSEPDIFRQIPPPMMGAPPPGFPGPGGMPMPPPPGMFAYPPGMPPRPPMGIAPPPGYRMPHPMHGRPPMMQPPQEGGKPQLNEDEEGSAHSAGK